MHPSCLGDHSKTEKANTSLPYDSTKIKKLLISWKADLEGLSSPCPELISSSISISSSATINPQRDRSKSKSLPTFSRLHAIDRLVTILFSTWPIHGSPLLRHHQATLFNSTIYIVHYHTLTLLRLIFVRLPSLITANLRTRTLHPLTLLTLHQQIVLHRTYHSDAVLYLLCASLLHPSRPSIHWHDLRLFNTISRVRLPKRNVNNFTIPYAAGTAFLLVYEILAVELTLKWHEVTGLAGLAGVGQLIPCVIGVGGVVKVANSAVRAVVRRKGAWSSGEEEWKRVEEKESEGERDMDGELAEAYFGCKEVWERMYGNEEDEAGEEFIKRLDLLG
ncbi:MAG: hypothetical protein Q9227_005029 [Pyrenula ochraceoflavens]